MRREKKRKFFGKIGKGKNKLKREFSTKKRTTEEKKRKERGVRSIERSKRKKLTIIELSNLNWRHNLNATYVR